MKTLYVILLCCCVQTCFAQEPYDSVIMRLLSTQWRMALVYETGSHFDDQTDPKKLFSVNSMLSFTGDKIDVPKYWVYFPDTCGRPVYRHSKIRAIDALEDSVYLRGLNIKADSLDIIATGCKALAFDTVYFLDKDRFLLTNFYMYRHIYVPFTPNHSANTIDVLGKWFLYRTPDLSKKTNHYLEYGQNFEIVEKQGKWVKIIYTSPYTGEQWRGWLQTRSYLAN